MLHINIIHKMPADFEEQLCKGLFGLNKMYFLDNNTVTT